MGDDGKPNFTVDPNDLDVGVSLDTPGLGLETGKVRVDVDTSPTASDVARKLKRAGVKHFRCTNHRCPTYRARQVFRVAEAIEQGCTCPLCKSDLEAVRT